MERERAVDGALVLSFYELLKIKTIEHMQIDLSSSIGRKSPSAAFQRPQTKIGTGSFHE